MPTYPEDDMPCVEDGDTNTFCIMHGQPLDMCNSEADDVDAD